MTALQMLRDGGVVAIFGGALTVWLARIEQADRDRRAAERRRYQQARHHARVDRARALTLKEIS